MAHYAFLDDNDVVVEVITGIDENETIEGEEPEIWYGKYRGLRCVRTSYNGNIRKNYAGIGYTYHEAIDAFVPPQCHEEALLDETTALWICDNPAHQPPEITE